MKSETAYKLMWPWEVDRRGMAGQYVVIDGKPVEIRYPSVEEMLVRMPPPVTIEKVHDIPETTNYLAYYQAGKYNHSEYASTPGEALALLCIWLRDNKLMEWREPSLLRSAQVLVQ